MTQDWLARYQGSPQWKEGKFENIEQTETALNWRKMPGILCRQLKGHKQGAPSRPLQIAPFDAKAFLAKDGAPKFAWFGHSAVLMRLMGQTLLIDPMLGDDASPIAPMKTKRFSDDSLRIIDELPTIDLVLITHDHYDHLDYESIQKLRPKAKHFFVSLGVKRHLCSWGIAAEAVEEFDWWQSKTFQNIQITFTPTRHFSGRGLSSLSKCLWGGWTFKTATENIWFSGDGGYGGHFKEVGEKLGPFDLAFMECGQYNDDWPQVHLFPHESVRAALDARAKTAVPVHWGGFNLSYQHSWFDPAEEFAREANEKGLAVRTPALGQVFGLDTPTNYWWHACMPL